MRKLELPVADTMEPVFLRMTKVEPQELPPEPGGGEQEEGDKRSR